MLTFPLHFACGSASDACCKTCPPSAHKGRTLVTLLIMLLTASSAWAKDATIDGINYKIYSGYAIVGSNKTFAGPTVNIPDKIKYNNKSYDVTQGPIIHPRACFTPRGAGPFFSAKKCEKST